MIARLKSSLNSRLYGLRARLFRSGAVPIGDSSELRIRTSTANEVHRLATLFTKEPETIAWIRSFPSDSVFYDVGANIGIYALYAGLLHQGIRIFAFEPEAQSFASLCQNIYLNRLKSVMPYQFALSDKTGIDSLFVASMDAGAGAAALGGDYRFMAAPSDGALKQGVFHCSLDSLVFDYKLPVPNFIKIDVDGLEKEILKGSERVLAMPDLKSVLVELQYRDTAEITVASSRLRPFGLELAEKSEWVAEFNGLFSQNFIFTKAPRAA